MESERLPLVPPEIHRPPKLVDDVIKELASAAETDEIIQLQVLQNNEDNVYGEAESRRRSLNG